MDVMYVDPQLKDNPVVGNEKNAFGDPVENEINDKNQPELPEVPQRLIKTTTRWLLFRTVGALL